jgi:hypothetical protein
MITEVGTAYLAGKMRGVPYFNFPAFDTARGDLRSKGWKIFCPAEHDRNRGLDEKKFPNGDFSDQPDFDWKTFMTNAMGWDLSCILNPETTCVIALPGWETSTGFYYEATVAHATGKPVYEYDGDFLKVIDLPDVITKPVIAQALVDEHQTTGEVRVTSSTGGQKGSKPAQLGTIDPLALLALSRVGGMGAKKYERYNYLKGYSWELDVDAANRHMELFQAGEDLDQESGLPHTAHFAWHGLALTSFLLRGLGVDDRPPAADPALLNALILGLPLDDLIKECK